MLLLFLQKIVFLKNIDGARLLSRNYMMNKKLKNIFFYAVLSVFIVACDDTVTYSEMKEKEIKTIKEYIKEQGINIKILSLDPYKDPDELIKALGRNEFLNRISQARSAERFLYQRANPDDKVNLLAEMLIAKRDR